MSRQPVFALVGNPNCGKSTLFNALTGLKQKIGNYPGVTVEKKTGTAYTQHGHPLTLIDLPGTYSLAARSPDEAVTRDVLLGRRADTPLPDRVLCIVDATNLERNLYLVHQVLDLGRPVVLVLNMMDLAAQAGIDVRAARLEKELGVPVIPCEAVNGKGLVELKLAMSRPEPALSRHAWDVPAAIAPAVAELQSSLTDADAKPPLIARAEALLLLTDPNAVRVAGSTPLSDRTASILATWKQRWEMEGTDWSGILVNSRYDAIARLTEGVIVQHKQRPSAASIQQRSDRIDAVLTHPVLGWLALGAIMTALFLSIFLFAGYPMGLIESLQDAATQAVQSRMAEGDLRDLITDGVIAGVGSVIVFLPQILILFFFIGLLESTGYMARVAFIMDRLMAKVGLNGKAFIPLLSSYACAIPGIMATRTMENSKDRLVTILIAPFMSCSARLPVYLLMIAMLVPGSTFSDALLKVGIMVGLYALGTTGAFGFAWLFKRTLIKGEPSLMIMELPPYRLPRLGEVVRQMAERGWMFLRRAGTTILGISIVLWFLAAYPKINDSGAAGGEVTSGKYQVASEAGAASQGAKPKEIPNAQNANGAASSPATSAERQLEQSFAGMAGRAIEPIIEPLGFDWRIGIGIIGSLAAREVFISTMGTVFSIENADEEPETLRDAFARAAWPDGRPLFTPLVCVTLLVFYVFAMQCLATLAVVRRETNSLRWPAFQLAYMTGTAWVVCLVIHQGGRLLGF
ncbi:ferrous iron transport protein B [Termitidicoccus mucosus]|uniref:Ferrous iron transport protein B n=1 Tax=Termitidicoccus mucosus TaxID=1184151 RepID=A0A178INL4_9BACT|nr:ferrous iron transporter B [Opitutaceae bacterium TSB47]